MEIPAYTINSSADEKQTPHISGIFRLTSVKDDLMVPSASLVVMVEPTIEPTAPTVDISAG